MEVITAKEAHERTTYAIPIDKKDTINFILADIQFAINKRNYSLEYCRGSTDYRFFNDLLTSTVQDFFKNLGYHYTYSYGDWLSAEDSITISW